MATTLRRTREKGQRTQRSIHAYQQKDGISGASYCRCGAVFKNKRWLYTQRGTPSDSKQELVCPACHRVADKNPAGIVTLSGGFLTVHQAIVDNLITNLAEEAVIRNPLGRVMDVIKGEDTITITTTDVKLAQKIGREMFKSFGGDLHYAWSQGEDLVRVHWSRQTA
ncbi:MAG: BCAM0308 family protein [Geobacter sp.]|nr:BCAM0308 family protein [Geobacter sp.]